MRDWSSFYIFPCVSHYECVCVCGGGGGVKLVERTCCSVDTGRFICLQSGELCFGLRQWRLHIGSFILHCGKTRCNFDVFFFFCTLIYLFFLPALPGSAWSRSSVSRRAFFALYWIPTGNFWFFRFGMPARGCGQDMRRSRSHNTKGVNFEM